MSGEGAHTEARFTFTARAPLNQVAPLFGASKERVWASGWDPKFIFPLPETDVEGMVFTVTRDRREAIWVNTDFDLENGRVQYVYVVPDAFVTVITLRISLAGDHCEVQVRYARTALRAAAGPEVVRLAEQDRRAGPEWEGQVNGWLLKGAANHRA